jgi:hypothetical protein
LVFGGAGELTPKKATTADDLVDLFRPYGIPPTRLHRAVQEAATEAGWIAPWDADAAKLRNEKAKNKAAGKRSGLVRTGLAMMRRSLVMAAHARLKPAHRLHPFSIYSINALREEYLQLLAPEAKNLDLLVSLMLAALSENDRKILRKVGRETLIKDLKMLDLRRKPKQQRPG